MQNKIGTCSAKHFKDLYTSGVHRDDIAQECNCAIQTIKNRASQMNLSRGIMNKEHTTHPKEEVMKKDDSKPTVEARNDNKIIINWETKTIITDLGEFGSVVASFNTHGAIQRYYVDAYGEKHTASETAMKFPIFRHPKAVYIYARLHGFSKASPGQTDIEFEEGLTEEDAIEENIQAIKARVSRKTEIRKWQEVQKKADKWDSFHHGKYLPMKDWIESSLPKFKPLKFKKTEVITETAWIIGFNDWHYRKFCYDHKGKTTYDRKKAIQELTNGVHSLLTKGLKYGTPERIYSTLGGDNLTTDNSNETTTAGTPQIGQVEGVRSLDMEKYVDTTIRTYEALAQVAPLTIVPTLGNHDKETSLMLYIFLKHMYSQRENVDVIESYLSRTYIKYGNNGMGFAHGDDMSLAKWKRNAHKLFLVEAREQRINLNTTRNLMLFLQHLHTDMYEDLGGVRQYVLPAPPPPDEWHNKSGYIGNYIGMSLHLIDKKKGIQGVLYA